MIVLWQSSHAGVVSIWVGCLPVAITPSWQLEQVPLAFEWSKRAPSQVNVLWQSSHSNVVCIWAGCLPVAITPLWQLEQILLTVEWS